VAKPIAVVALGGNAILEPRDDGSFSAQLGKATAACRHLLAILVLPTANWLEIQRHQAVVTDAVNAMQVGSYRELRW